MLEELRTEVRNTIYEYCADPYLRDAALHALARPGFALNGESRCRAGILSLEAYRAIGGEPGDAAVQAAAAIELQMESAFMFDSVADQDVDPNDGLTPAEELALAISLLSCGNAAASQAAHRIDPTGSTSWRMQQLHRSQIEASTGQFLDASLQKFDRATVDQGLEMTSRKAGGLGKLSAGLGASLATDDPEIVGLFEDFGSNVFTYLQLVDDLRDACPDGSDESDLSQHKKTVPLIYFYDYLSQRASEAGNGIIPPLESDDAQIIQREFRQCGAPLFCAVVAETFLNRAKSNLADLENLLGTVQNLEHLLDAIEAGSQEVLAVT